MCVEIDHSKVLSPNETNHRSEMCDNSKNTTRFFLLILTRLLFALISISDTLWILVSRATDQLKYRENFQIREVELDDQLTRTGVSVGKENENDRTRKTNTFDQIFIQVSVFIRLSRSGTSSMGRMWTACWSSNHWCDQMIKVLFFFASSLGGFTSELSFTLKVHLGNSFKNKRTIFSWLMFDFSALNSIQFVSRWNETETTRSSVCRYLQS